MREVEEEGNPLIIAKGEGSDLIDIHGKRYLDGVSSIWVNIHGHRHPKIVQAIIRQIRTLAHSTLLGLTHLPAIQLAEKLIELAPPGLTKVFYSDNGSTAVEVAVKMAYAFWQQRDRPRKKKFISFAHAYHGDTLGSVSLGGIDLFHHLYHPLLFETLKVPAPTCYHCPLSLQYPSCKMACAMEVEKVMAEHTEEIAGLVIEPLVQAAAGMFTAPVGYLKEMRRLCDQYGILMIADEVATGFGRTGKMFACEHEQVTPDLMAIAKGMTGGYLPLAATLTTQEIYDVFLGEYAQFKTFFHGHSYTGNPLGCAAAIANIKIFEEEQVLTKLAPKIGFLKEALRPLRRWTHVGDIRQIGFMAGIELVMNKKEKMAYPLEWRMGKQVCDEARKRGVLLRPLGNVLALVPPLSISMKDLKRLISVVKESIQSMVLPRG